MTRARLTLIVVVCVALLPGIATAATLNVPADHATIQAAIDASVDGDEVVVAPGTYYENINFNGKAITVRSTDLTDPSVVAATIIDGQANGSVVTFNSEEGPSSVLSGLTIQNGSCHSGAGVVCYVSGGLAASPTIAHNVIKENTASHGGGLHCGGTTLVQHNTIANNTAGGSGGGLCSGGAAIVSDNVVTGNTAAHGGGVSCGGSATVTGNQITGNTGSYGGGLYCGGSVTVTDNEITGNGGHAGGGLYCSGSVIVSHNQITGNSAAHCGGGIHGTGCSGTFSDNIISRNTGGYAGGIWNYNSTTTISGNLITRNTCSVGGGIGLDSSSDTIIGNTISDNSATSSGGGMFIRGTKGVKDGEALIIRNNIIAKSLEGEGIYLDANIGQPNITYCNVWGNYGGEYGGLLPDLTGTDGNISEDPLFADAAHDDYHVQSSGGRWDPSLLAWVFDALTSACVDAGDPMSDYSQEPQRNGGRVNLGTHGNTQYASKSDNSAPTVAAVEITPDPAFTDDDLVAVPSGWSDPEGDAPGYSWIWMRNTASGWEVIPGAITDTLDHIKFTGNDHIKVLCTPDDRKMAPLAVGPSVSDEITISNSPPSIESVTIAPIAPGDDDDLTATPNGWVDADGDPEGYLWQWRMWDGAWTDIAGATSATLGHENFGIADQVQVVCTPTDGEDTGDAVTAEVTIVGGPVLSWLGIGKYVDDGVDPDRGIPMRKYTFKVRYTGAAPDYVRLHLFRNGVEVYGSPYDLRPGGGQPATGQTFWIKRRLWSGTYSYRFSASDGAHAATGEPTQDKDGPYVGNKAPRLAWAGGKDFDTCGVKPRGCCQPGAEFTWKVTYSDPDGDAAEYVRLHVALRADKDGDPEDTEIAGSPFDMTAETKNYRQGVVYTHCGQLEVEGRYVCWFSARERAPDGLPSQQAHGEPTWHRQSAVRVFNAPPRLSWAAGDQFGDDAPPDGVRPNRCKPAAICTFRVRYEDPEGVEPEYVRLHLLRWDGSEYVEVATSPYDMTADGDDYSTTLVPPRAGVYRHYFAAGDGVKAAVGEPSWHLVRGPVVRERSSGWIVVRSLACCPAAGGAQVTFTLSADAAVTVEVLNIAGRPVRALVSDRPMTAGISTLVWDGANGTGLRVPAGMYLVRVKAADEAGGISQALANVRVTR